MKELEEEQNKIFSSPAESIAGPSEPTEDETEVALAQAKLTEDHQNGSISEDAFGELFVALRMGYLKPKEVREIRGALKIRELKKSEDPHEELFLKMRDLEEVEIPHWRALAEDARDEASGFANNITYEKRADTLDKVVEWCEI